MQQPNVLLIMSDQHHKRVMGCAGHPLIETPHLDQLAARGTRFGNAYCNFPLCGPSRAAFMTAKQPHRIDVWTNASEFRSDIPTFAHAFGAAGYETVLSGRMHFVGMDQRHGFARRLIGDCPESAYIAAGWQLGNVLGGLRDTPGTSRVGIDKSGPGRSGYLAYDEAVAEATVAFLHRRDNHKQPLLLTVGFAMPHCPFVADPADFELYAERVSTPPLEEDDLADLHPLLQARRRACEVAPLPPPETRARVTAAYFGMVTHLDRQVGRILRALEDAGMADNTIIVYTSDHGEQLGEHGLWWKSTFYDGSVGVPLIVARPGETTGGQVRDENVSLTDIGPTALDLAGVEPLPAADGSSFRCLLDGDRAPWPDLALAEYTDPGSGQPPQRMVRRGRWKYVYCHGHRPQLFDMIDDPDENHDLWETPENETVRREMQSIALADWDPEAVASRLAEIRRELAVIGKWDRQVHPSEPDPLWYDTPPENRLDRAPSA